MHELGITDSILKISLKHALKANASKIISISLTIGSLSDLEDDWLRKYFDHLSKGTLAEGAKLLIERTPVKFLCKNCNHEFILDLEQIKDVACDNCLSTNLALISGREYKVVSMEIV